MGRPEWEVIGIVGGATTAYDPASKILTLAVPDIYESLPQKIHAAVTWIAENRPGISGIFKTDDDIVVDPILLAETVVANQHREYWGFAVKTTKAGPITDTQIQLRFTNKQLQPTHQSAKYCFGAGYWLSASVIPRIVAASTDYATSPLEDVCTGYVLNRAKHWPTRIQLPWTEWPRTPKLLALK